MLFQAIAALAQKLPQTQTTGIWAPANIMIDGLADEWKSFQAYNKATNIWYTLANDNNNLYLAVHATDPVIIDKMISASVTLTVGSSGNETSVTFPAYDQEHKIVYTVMFNAPDAKSASIDTFIRSKNALMSSRQKIIRIERNQQVEDISIYNESGVKVAGQIDNHLSYTLELSVPIKYLNMANNITFPYQITINGRVPKNAIIVDVGRPDIILWKDADGTQNSLGKATPENLMLAYPTSLKATYSIARK